MKKLLIVLSVVLLTSFSTKNEDECINSNRESTLAQISVKIMLDDLEFPCTMDETEPTLNVYGPSSYVSYCITNLSGCSINTSCLDSYYGDVIDRYTLTVTSSSGISFRVKAYDIYNEFVDQEDFSYVDCSEFY